MTCLNTPLPASAIQSASLMPPLALTAQAARVIEHAAAQALARVARDLVDARSLAAPTLHPVGCQDEAECEYASWMPDPGAIEVASWSAHMQPSVQ